MSSRLYEHFAMQHRYLVGNVQDYIETDDYELIVHLTDGTSVIYDGITGDCRPLPSNARLMSERECTAEFGARLRRIMRRKSCTQSELSARTGISQAMISYYITGKRTPSFYNADRIAKALGCSTDDLRYI